MVAVAYHQKCIVVEGMRDAMFAHVVSEIVVEAGADVPVNRLQLNEDQRQAVDEANQVRPPVVVRHANALDLQLAHGEEAIVSGVAKVDHLCVSVPGLAAGVAPVHGNPAADEGVELAVVLNERPSEVDPGQLLDGLLPRLGWNVPVQPCERRPQVAHQHGLPVGGASQRSRRPERLRVVCINAVPTEHLFEMFGKRLLDQAVFAVDAGDHRCVLTRFTISCTTRKARSTSNSRKSFSRRTGFN